MHAPGPSDPRVAAARGVRIAMTIMTGLALVLVLAGVVRVHGADHPIVIRTSPPPSPRTGPTQDSRTADENRVA